MSALVNAFLMFINILRSHTHTHTHIYIYRKKVKLATVVEGELKATTVATTPWRKGSVLLLSLDCSTLPLIHIL